MKFTFRGNLSGNLCEECFESLSGVEVLLYLPWQKDNVVSNAVADPKDTFRLVTKDESIARKDLLIASSKTDEMGNYEFTVDEKYSKTAFDIDFTCGTVPRVPPKPPRKEPLQFHLTTIFPQWKIDKQREIYYFQWDYTLSAKWWCYIRGNFFDAWVICGHLRNCETGIAIANASVTAWDADFFKDDNLGTAITDSSGHFRIDYTSTDFKKTFLSPLINVETDPGFPPTFHSGPDVYFKASIGGVKLIDETSADRRNNVGYCLCVNLCSKINVGNPGDSNFPSAWTGIGLAFNISTGSGPKDFDALGYAGPGKYALSSVIRLTGQAAPKASSGNHIEYRFLVSGVTTPNGGAAPSLANFTKIVGVTAGLFYPGTVAKLMEKAFPFTVYDVISDQADFDAEGWYDINTAVNRTLTNNGIPLANINNYWFIDEDTLIALDTRALTTAADVPAAAASVGNVVPAGNKIPIEKVAIRFEIREVVNKAANIFNVIPGSGKTLNSAIINNNSMFMKLSITELEVSGLCTPISGTVHAKYTVYHPHLASSSLHLNNNSYTVNRDISGDGFLTLSGNINPIVDGGANNNLALNNPPNDMTKCTYSLKLYARARLHNGDSAWGDSGPVEQLFYYNI
jgi:hypothetical protein